MDERKESLIAVFISFVFFQYKSKCDISTRIS